MASQGPNNGSTFVNDATVGTIDWTTPENAQTSNDIYASAALYAATVPPYPTSKYLKATGFGFSIPAGSTINGIMVEVERKLSTADTIKDNSVKIVKGNTIQGDEKALPGVWPISDTYATYGGSAVLWGLAWTAENINDSTFGFVISAYALYGEATYYAYADHIRITVYYTATAAYVLSADPGAYVLTGVDAQTLASRILNADPGSYSKTGQGTGLVVAREMAALPGSYVVTGFPTALLAFRQLIAESGGYNLTGFDAVLLAQRLLSADPGSYTITGLDAELLIERVLWTKIPKQDDKFIKSLISMAEDWFKSRWFISGWFVGDIGWTKILKQLDNWSKT